MTQFAFFCRLTCAKNCSGRWGRTRDRSWRGNLMGRRVPDSWRDRAQGRIWFEGWLELPIPTSSRSCSRKSSSQEGTVSPSLFEEVILTTNLLSVDINIIIRDGTKINFQKSSKGEGGRVANCPAVFLSYFSMWICYEIQLTNKKIKMSNTSRLSRGVPPWSIWQASY